MKLERSYVEKPWGRTQLPPMFDPPPGKRIGEVWFTGPPELPLLAKYIFTSERLSIQVHPDDAQAKARGLASGKSECWYILDAERGATLALGLKREMSQDKLRAAALNGSIEHLVDWRGVRAGDFVFVASRSVHAIGAGISLLEFQQNSDVTYRLYDYGRARELHVDDAVAVANRAPFGGDLMHLPAGEERTLVAGPHFTLVHTRRDALQDRLRWVLPIEGHAWSGGDVAGPGECLLVGPRKTVESDDARMLIGASC